MQEKILLYDGVCNLCNGAVKFVLKHEKKPEIMFASLQSALGKKLLAEHNIDILKTDSLVFISNGKAKVKSTAGLNLFLYLKGLYPLMIVFVIVPAFLRDIVYNWIARNRYKWFGRSEACVVPDEKTRNRFLDL